MCGITCEVVHAGSLTLCTLQNIEDLYAVNIY